MIAGVCEVAPKRQRK
jgi:hypothetical protein